MISTMAFWKKLKIKMRQIKRLVISKSKQEKGRAERNFRAVKTLHYILMMDICHYIFVQTNRMHNTKRKSKVNCELWMIMMC